MSFLSGNPFFQPDAMQNGTFDKLTGRNQPNNGPAPPTASDLFASATRQQWSQYVNTFVPIENKLISYATDPNTVSNAMAGAHQDVTDAFTAQQGATQRRLASLGTTLAPDEQQAQNLSSGLTQSLADVQAQNTARDLTTQRQQAILGNPAPQGASQ